MEETIETKKKCGELVSSRAEQGGQQTPTLSELDAEALLESTASEIPLSQKRERKD